MEAWIWYSTEVAQITSDNVHEFLIGKRNFSAYWVCAWCLNLCLRWSLPQTVHHQRVVVKHMKKLAISSNMYSNFSTLPLKDIPPRSLQWRHPIPKSPDELSECPRPCRATSPPRSCHSFAILKTNPSSNTFVAKTPSSGLRQTPLLFTA